MTHAKELAPAINSSRTPSKLVWTALILLCVIAAAAALRRIAALSSSTTALSSPSTTQRSAQMAALDTSFASRKVLTLSHIVPALLFVTLLPAWFSRRVRSHVAAHRRITHALFLLGAIIGVTAIPLSAHPIGGVNEAAAALLYDSLFLFSLGRAWIMLRRSDLERHRTWMMRAIAVLLGIATTRPIMGVFFATESLTHLQPREFFGTAFWIGFTTTYIAGEAYLRRRSTLPA